MKRNLSRSARISYISVSKATSLITGIISRWIKSGATSGEEAKLFKDGIETLNKALDVMTSSLETRVLIRILDEAKDSTIEIINKKDAKPSSSLVDNEVLNILIEKVLFWCNPCDIKDYNICTVREVLKTLGVPEYDCHSKPNSDRCSYCYSVKPGKKLTADSNDFTEYCQKHYNLTPQKELLEAFEDLLAFNVAYYDKNGVSEKVLRKFIEFHRERL